MEKGGRNENGRVTSPESVPIYLYVYGYTSMFCSIFYKARVRELG